MNPEDCARPGHPASAADARAVAALAGLTALVAWNRLAFDAWLARFDLLTFFVPWYTFLGERLRALDVPGWNPHLFSGAAFAGDPESGWLYLPAMLTFTFFPILAAFKAMVAVHLFVAGLSTYAFARVLGLGPMAALVAAVVYAFGPFLQWNTYCCLIFAQFATWIPLALLGVELALRAHRWRDRLAPWFASGFAISQMFAGWAGEGWLYALLLVAAYTGYRALLSPSRPGLALRTRFADAATTGFVAPGLGLALGAAAILPRLAVNAQTHLAGGDYAELGAEGILNPPWRLDYLLVQTLGVGTGYHFRAAALGGAATVLVLLAPAVARRRFAVPFFAVLTLVALTLTLDTTPLHRLFYLIPRYQGLHEHDPWRTVALATIGPAILSGAAVEALTAWRGRRHLLPLVAAPLLLLAVAALVLRRVESFLGWSPLLAAAVVTVAIAVAVAAPRAGALGHIGRWAPGLILLVAFVQPTGLELTGSWLGWPRHPIWKPQWHPDPALAAARAVEVADTDPLGAGAFLQARLAEHGPFRYVGYGGTGHPADPARQSSYMGRRFEPNVQAILVNGRPVFLGLSEIQGYNPLQLARYAEFVEAINGVALNYHVAYLLPSGASSPLLDLLNVRYVLIDAGLPPDRADVLALRSGRREVLRTPHVVVYETDPAPPHAWIVHDVRPVARGDALPLLTAGAIDPFRTALVEGTPPETRTPAGSPPESARVTRHEPDRLTIAVNAAAPGLLVVSEIYESGWRAYVDGDRVDVFPTHHALRGVPTPAGDHTVELRYEPLALRLGLPISGTATLAMLITFAATAWSHIRRPSHEPAAERLNLGREPTDPDNSPGSSAPVSLTTPVDPSRRT